MGGVSEQSTEFANPVPDARWDGSRGRRFRWAAALLGAVSLLAIARIAWTAFEVAHGIRTVTELAGITHASNSSPAREGHYSADGASDLPGAYATLAFAPLPGQFEYWERADEHGAYGSSRWGLATADDGRMNQVDLSHWLLAPLDDAVEEENQKIRADNSDKTITGPRRIEIDGHRGATWKATWPNGDVRYTTWFFGDVHSFRLECRYVVGADDFAKQCKDILRSLEFAR